MSLGSELQLLVAKDFRVVLNSRYLYLGEIVVFGNSLMQGIISSIDSEIHHIASHTYVHTLSDTT